MDESSDEEAVSTVAKLLSGDVPRENENIVQVLKPFAQVRVDAAGASYRPSPYGEALENHDPAAHR